MRLLKRLAIGLIAALALLAAGAYLLPRHAILDRSITIDAPPEAIFPHLNALEAFAEWSPWTGRDPDMQLRFSGPPAGVGNVMEWTSQDRSVGSGLQEIVASVANERVASELDFGAMGTAFAWFELTPTTGGTQVTWGLDSDMGNSPMGRYFGLMIDDLVGADYQLGLGAGPIRPTRSAPENARDQRFSSRRHDWPSWQGCNAAEMLHSPAPYGLSGFHARQCRMALK